MTTPAARLTLDEFLAMPETKPYREFVRGQIVEKATVTPPHSALVRELIVELGIYLRETGEARVDTELRHADAHEERSYLPDVSVTRLSRFPKGQRERPGEVAPDLAIEVLSPTDEAGNVVDKVNFYLRAGVELIWVVDPKREAITVYQRGAAPAELRAPAILDARPVLTNLAIDLSALFDRARD